MKQKMLALLLVISMMVLFIPVVSFGESTEVEFVSLRYDEPTALYLLDDGQTVTPNMTVTVKNNTANTLNGKMTALFTMRTANDVITWSKDSDAVSFDVESGKTADVTLPGVTLTQVGYYIVTVKVEYAGKMQIKEYGLGVIRPPYDGVIEDSMFGFGFSESTLDADKTMEIGRRMGVKWRRGALNPRIVMPTKDGPVWGQAEKDEMVSKIDKWKEKGILTVGMIDYNLSWNVRQDSPMGVIFQIHQNCPDDMELQAEAVYELLKATVGHITAVEIWNEPWIHGWTWKTGSTQDYRNMAKIIYDKVRSDPELDSIALLGGGSAGYSRDVLYSMNADGEFTTTYIDGSINHPYGHITTSSSIPIEIEKRLDQKGSVTNGKGGLWFTEFAAAPEHVAHVPEDERVYEAGRNVAPLYLSMFQGTCDTDVPAHGFWFTLADSTSERDENGDIKDFQYNIYNPRTNTPRPAVVAYAAASHFMENRQLADNWDLFPASKSLMGFLMQDKQNGKTNAMIYSNKDQNGKIKIKNARGLKIYNYLGTPLFDGSEDSFETDLRYWETLYIESDMQADELRAIIEQTDITLDQPLYIYPLSFTKPVSGISSIDIMVENTSASTQNGILELTQIPNGFVMNEQTVEVKDLKPGEKRTINFSVRFAKEDELNRYDVSFKATFGSSVWSGSQTIQSAYAPKKEITVDGSLDDWNDIIGVSMVSNGTVDAQALSLDPELARQIAQGGKSVDNTLALYKLKTAWDDENFYMCAEIADESPNFLTSFDIDDYIFPFQSDCVQIGINCGVINKDNLFIDKVGEPGYDKYYGDDTNYEFSFRRADLGNGEYGSEIERLIADGTNGQTYYPGNPGLNPKLGTIDAYERGGSDGKIITWHDEKEQKWYCEAAVNWKNISILKNQIDSIGDNNSMECAINWAVDDTGSSSRGTSFWTREAGMEQTGAQGLAPHYSTGWGGRIITPWGFGNLKPQDIAIMFGGRRLALDVSPVIEDGRTLVPVRAALEAMGAAIEYDAENRVVTGTRGDTTFKLTIDNTRAVVNGQERELDVPAKIINDRTMVPIRFVAENFGAKVEWDDVNRAVLIEE